MSSVSKKYTIAKKKIKLHAESWFQQKIILKNDAENFLIKNLISL